MLIKFFWPDDEREAITLTKRSIQTKCGMLTVRTQIGSDDALYAVYCYD